MSLDRLTPADREETERLFALFNLGNCPALPFLFVTKSIPSFANDLSIPTWEQIHQTLTSAASSASGTVPHLEELLFKEKLSLELEERVRELAERQRSIVRIDVGGQVFCASRETLLSCKDSYFHGLLNSGQFQPDDEGTVDSLMSLF